MTIAASGSSARWQYVHQSATVLASLEHFFDRGQPQGQADQCSIVGFGARADLSCMTKLVSNRHNVHHHRHCYS